MALYVDSAFLDDIMKVAQAYSSAVEVAHDIETIEKEGIHKEMV